MPLEALVVVLNLLWTTARTLRATTSHSFGFHPIGFPLTNPPRTAGHWRNALSRATSRRQPPQSPTKPPWGRSSSFHTHKGRDGNLPATSCDANHAINFATGRKLFAPSPRIPQPYTPFSAVRMGPSSAPSVSLVQQNRTTIQRTQLTRHFIAAAKSPAWRAAHHRGQITAGAVQAWVFNTVLCNPTPENSFARNSARGGDWVLIL